VVQAQTVSTGAGDVEFVRLGEGPPVLVVHGTPGGSDQGAVIGAFLVDAGFEVIAPSRPGYMGAPLESGPTIDEQADLHAALLDSLGIERAGLLFWSGGGPSSYRLAVRHPGRVTALVAFDAVSKKFEIGEQGLDEKLMLTTRPGNWLIRFLATHAPKTMAKSMLEAEGDLSKEELKQRVAEVVGDERKLRFVEELATTVSYREPRKAGFENDLVQYAAIDSLQLDRIQAPALIVHGSVDTDVTPDHGDHAAAEIPNAELLSPSGGTHLCLYTHPEADQAQERAISLLRGRRAGRVGEGASWR
jgi:pimeloyl-ACP methyl ester carboxylesterase